MDEERAMVLRMLKEGKISVEEADALLQELAEQPPVAAAGEPEEAAASAQAGTEMGPELRDELRGVFRELMESIPGDIRRELHRAREVIRPSFREVLRGLSGLAEGRAETGAEEPMSSGDTLDLRQAWGDVRLRAEGEGPMRLHAVRRVWSSSPEEAQRAAERLPVEIRRDGSTVVVHVPRMEGRRTRVDFEITVPKGVHVRIDIAKGDVRVEDAAATEVRVARGDVLARRLTGGLRADVLSGDLELRGIDGDVRLEVKSGDVAAQDLSGRLQGRIISGDVAVSGSAGVGLDIINGDVAVANTHGPVDVATKSGDVALGSIRSTDVRIRTLSGDVAVDLVELTEGSLVVETVSGDIKLALPPDSRTAIDAQTRSGEISTELALSQQTTGFRSLRGVLNAPGATVRLQATSGDIRIIGR